MQKTSPSDRAGSSSEEGAWSVSTIIGVVLSALEALRRSCRGCLDICWRSLAKGWVGTALARVAEVLGVGSGRVEL